MSRTVLGKYEADNFKDIRPFRILTLAKFYGVPADYLMCLVEQKNYPEIALSELHLSDNAMEVLKNGKFNKRLLSEMLCHSDFQRMMLNAEISVDER